MDFPPQLLQTWQRMELPWRKTQIQKRWAIIPVKFWSVFHFSSLCTGNWVPLCSIVSLLCPSSTVLPRWCLWIPLATWTCVRTWLLAPTNRSAFWEDHSEWFFLRPCISKHLHVIGHLKLSDLFTDPAWGVSVAPVLGWSHPRWLPGSTYDPQTHDQDVWQCLSVSVPPFHVISGAPLALMANLRKLLLWCSS